jgi:hypothetical protein
VHLVEEVWAQLVQSFEERGDRPLVCEDVMSWFVDPSLTFQDGRPPRNDEPLLINTVGSWKNRPEAVTAIPNLFLAADFVRTHTDVASMESANEAARRAVNGVLAAAGATAEACSVWRLDEPALFAPLRALDRRRFQRGMPHVGYQGVGAGLDEALPSSRPEAYPAVVGSESEIEIGRTP